MLGWTTLGNSAGESKRKAIASLVPFVAPEREISTYGDRVARSTHHPDNGGDPKEFNAVQLAYEQAIIQWSEA